MDKTKAHLLGQFYEIISQRMNQLGHNVMDNPLQNYGGEEYCYTPKIHYGHHGIGKPQIIGKRGGAIARTKKNVYKEIALEKKAALKDAKMHGGIKLIGRIVTRGYDVRGGLIGQAISSKKYDEIKNSNHYKRRNLTPSEFRELKNLYKGSKMPHSKPHMYSHARSNKMHILF